MAAEAQNTNGGVGSANGNWLAAAIEAVGDITSSFLNLEAVKENASAQKEVATLNYRIQSEEKLKNFGGDGNGNLTMVVLAAVLIVMIFVAVKK